MPITKDEHSDLQSLISRLVKTRLEEQQALVVREQAERQLENFIWKLANPPKEPQA